MGTEENLRYPSSTFQSSTHSFTAALTPVLLPLSHTMSHGMLSREELYKFYGFDLAADVDTQSAMAEFLDVSHFLVDDIDEVFPKLTAPASSEETYAATAPPLTNATSHTIDVFHTRFTGPVTGVPECPPILIPSCSGSLYPPISVPPSWCAPPMRIGPSTGQLTPILPSPTLPDPLLPQMALSTPSTPRGTKRKLLPPTPEPTVNKRARGRQVPISPDGKTVAGPSGAGKDRPFVCPVDECKKAFTRKEHLERHTVCLHTNTTWWTCTYDPKCTRTFPRRDNFKRHVKTDHPGVVWENPP